MKTLSLIANTGIQLYATRINLQKQDGCCKYFYEWINPVNKRCGIDAVYRLEEKNPDDDTTTVAYFNLRPLVENGWLAPDQPISISLLKKNGINPVAVEGEELENGKIYTIDFHAFERNVSKFENTWLPLPYFYQRKKQSGEVIYRKLGPLNWSRFKLIPHKSSDGVLSYDVVLALDTRARDKESLGVVEQKNNEYPVFGDSSVEKLDFGLCRNELLMMDYCAKQLGGSFVYDSLFSLFFPDKTDVSQLIDEDMHRYAFITSYLFLIDCIAETDSLPFVSLHRYNAEQVRPVDMVVSVGNDTTAALLVENDDFGSVCPLRLVNFTNPTASTDDSVSLRKSSDAFGMRLAFKQAYFGACGPNKSRQFVYPSFVRLGDEALELINASTACEANAQTKFQCSSPKNFLWDSAPSSEPWSNVVLKGEQGTGQIEDIPNLSRYISNSGELSVGGIGGQANRFSRRSLMTFAFLEMINQAYIQINSVEYRSRSGESAMSQPRQLRTIIVTGSSALLKSECDAMLNCAVDASVLFGKFFELRDTKITILPQTKRNADNKTWNFDEPTCSQLVYLYSEIAYKYKGCAKEFFTLFQQNKDVPLTIATVDIGAELVDMAVNEYTYNETDENVQITPNPLFNDMFHTAGNSLLQKMIQMVLDDENSALRKALSALSIDLYRQFVRDFFGQTPTAAINENVRSVVTICYSIPLVTHFLDLLGKNSCDCVVEYADFACKNPVNEQLVESFKSGVNSWLQNKGEKTCDVDLTKLQWSFSAKRIADMVRTEFEPLLKKVATMLHAYSCDVILLTGRLASLMPIRDIFLKYYAVSPDRLLVLNNSFVGLWYPFAQNTGYISNFKTIVPVGALLSNKAAAPSAYNQFSVQFDDYMKSVDSSKAVQFVEGQKNDVRTNYILTPIIKQGTVTVKQFPTNLFARQIDVDSYPNRVVYAIDVNQTKLVEKIRRQAIANGNMAMTDDEVAAEIEKNMNDLKERLPLTVVVERNGIDKDSLALASITDAKGEILTETCVDVQIRKVATEKGAWLDSGMFEF